MYPLRSLCHMQCGANYSETQYSQGGFQILEEGSVRIPRTFGFSKKKTNYPHPFSNL